MATRPLTHQRITQIYLFERVARNAIHDTDITWPTLFRKKALHPAADSSPPNHRACPIRFDAI